MMHGQKNNKLCQISSMIGTIYEAWIEKNV